MGIEAKRVLKRRGACSCTMTGVWRALNFVHGLVVIFHSPRACAHLARRMDLSSYFYNLADAPEECGLEAVPLLSSDLEDEEAVFGGENRLRRAIRYAAEKYQPQGIVIAGSCVAGVIGDDVDGIAAEAEAELGIPVLATPLHGYLDGEFFHGYIEGARLLVERFMEPRPAVPGTVLLLGDCGGTYGVYAQEVRRLLAYFGLHVTAQLPSYIDLKQLKEASSASVLIVLGRILADERQQKLVALGQEISARCGMPCLGDIYPVGCENTLAWLRRLGELLGKEEAAEAAIAAEQERFEAAVAEAAAELRGKKVVWCSGRAGQLFKPGELVPLLQRLGMELLGIRLFDIYSAEELDGIRAELAALCDAPLLTEQEAEAKMREADVVLTTHELLDPQLRQVFLPCVPSAGWTGELAVMRAMRRILKRRLSRGGLIYA